MNMRPRIRSEVICYVMAGLSRDASRFVRFKYAGDRSRRRGVIEDLARRVWKRREKRNTNRGLLITPKYIWDLAEVAVDEANSDGMCGRCNGKGWLDTGLKRIDCFSCFGSGRRKTGDIAIARKLGVGLDFYRLEGKSIMERHMLGILASYEGDLYNAFRERL
jgi:hypothetical protein